MSRRTIALALSAAALAGAVAFQRDAGAGGPDSDRESARVELGRRLFFDPALGRQGRVGCSSCHDPEHGFSDPRVLSQDETGLLPRHSQPLTDLAGEGFHWDGEFDTVADVVRARILPRAEALTASAERSLHRATMAAATPAQFDVSAARNVLAELGAGGGYYSDVRLSNLPSEPVTIADRISSSGNYEEGFRRAFGDPAATAPRMVDAVDAYVRSLRTTENALDRFLAGDPQALTPAACRGLELFRGRANCSACHLIEGARPLLTDGRFHDTGVAGGGVGGRRARTFAAADAAAFKTPSLRDVARRAPYMHDASLATLADVVRYYDKGGRNRADLYLDERIRPLGLSDTEVADLVAFLESLTGTTRAALGALMPWRPKRFVLRVETTTGTAVSGRTVHVRPFGDRLATADSVPPSFDVVTDAKGEAAFPFPPTTHLVLEAQDFPATRTLPDWTSRATLVVPSPARVSLIARFPGGSSWRPKVIRVYPDWRTRWADVLEFEPVVATAPDETLYEAAPPASPHGRSECQLGLTIAGDYGPSVTVDCSPGGCTQVTMPPLHLRTDPPSALSRANDAVRLLGRLVTVPRSQ